MSRTPQREAVNAGPQGFSRPLISSLVAIALTTALLAMLSGLNPALAATEPPETALDIARAAVTATVRPAGASTKRATADDISIVKTIQTGTGDNSFAYNGDFITYTIAITNNTGNTFQNILMLDLLPHDTFDKGNVQCSDACQRIVETQQFPGPTGDTIAVSVTRQLSWTISTLAPGVSLKRTFSGRTAGQADGTQFTNRAFISYNGTPGSGVSEVTTIARVRPTLTGKASLSGAATWFSEDLGGTISQDWADFDHDGKLDLALASSVGTSVYRNVNGKLERFWGNTTQSFGVAWGDFNNDGVLRLATVGDSLDHSPTTMGNNYIYSRVGNEFVQTGVFTSEFQLVRVVAGVFGGNGGRVDLLASSNTLNSSCPLFLFRNNGAGSFNSAGECVSSEPTAALAAADVNNDGYLDIVVGQFPNAVKVFLNDTTGHFTVTNSVNPINVDSTISFLPYDFSWGDYDADGYLDLAAAFPLQREVRIYRNLGGTGFAPPRILRTSVFLTPLSVAWGDFNGDRHLDLAVADAPPVVYQFDGVNFVPGMKLPIGAVIGQLWSMRAVQVRQDGTVDLAVTNRDGPTVMFNAFTPRLVPSLQPIDTFSANSVAWGDFDGTGTQDLLFGASGPPAIGARIYYNQNGGFASANRSEILAAGLGPHSVAVGDVNGDGKLDVALGTPSVNQLYLNNQLASNSSPTWTTSLPAFPIHVVAWGDVNGDGRLDLLAGANSGPVVIIRNVAGTLEHTPVFTTTELGNVTALAWSDFDKDGYQDFAVGYSNQPTRIYHNTHDNAFILAWQSPFISNTTSLSVADYNGDGFPDLAIGNYGQPSVVFENIAGNFGTAPVWTSPSASKATSVAWGDWNDDGLPELAIGNDGEATQVYANLNSIPGSARLFWLWSSNETPRTTGVAWGDMNGDGFLDLAVSQKSGGQNGVYLNSTVLPSYQSNVYTPTLPLPLNPPYISVSRPGKTKDAYLYSSSELLSGPLLPTVTVNYRIYSPGSARTSGLTPTNHAILPTYYEYSLDGGSTWHTATPFASASSLVTASTRTGQSGTFVWDAIADEAVSDNARFRVRAGELDETGPIQRTSNVAISPPFSVRGTTCVWPTNPSFVVNPPFPAPGTPAQFVATVEQGSGVLLYQWDFGDGTDPQFGQFADHTYDVPGTYKVRLTVNGELCPVTREAVATELVSPGGPFTDKPYHLYLPLTANTSVSQSTNPTGAPSATATATASATPTTTVEISPTATISPSVTPSASPSSTPTAAPSSTPPRPTATPSATASATAVPSPATATPSKTPTASATASANPTATSTPRGSATAGSTAKPTALPPVSLARLISYQQQPALLPARGQSGIVTTTQLALNIPANPGIPLRTASPAIAPTTAIACTFHPITNSSIGINNQPVVNANGTRVAFWSTNNLAGNNADGNIEIFVASVNGNALSFSQVTSSTGSILGGFNLAPSISGDGKRVAFFSDRNLTGQNADGNFEIFLANIGPSGSVSLTQVTTTTGKVNVLPSISANGQFIAFVSDSDLVPGGNTGDVSQIFRAEVGAGGRITYTQVTANGSDTLNDEPVIDAIGDKVAFVSNGKILLADIGPGVQLRTIANTSNNTLPTINGDGTKVAYASAGNIYLATVGAGINTLAVTTDGQNDQPSISKDGTRLSYISGGGHNVSVFDTVLGQSPLSGSPATTAAHPQVSGDGTHTAFVLNRDIVLSDCPFGELSITKTAAQQIVAGQTVTYTVVVNNAGPSVFTGVLMTDVLPAGVITLTVSPDQIDDENGGLGFGGGSNSGTHWVPGTGTLEIDPTIWELPNAGANSWFNSASNVLLMHLNEGAGATALADSSGLNNNGGCSAGTCPTLNVAGKLNTAARFDGASNFFSIPDASGLNFSAAQNFAIALWIQVAPTQADAANISNSILDKWNGSDSYPYIIQYYNQTSPNNGKIFVGRYDGTAAPGVFSNRNIGDGQFHHVAFVKSGGTLYLYVDGVLDSQTTDTTSGNTLNTDILNVGQHFGNTNHFQGVIDELAIFGRALSAQEVASIFGHQSAVVYGEFTSRVMNGSVSGFTNTQWTNLEWIPKQPQLKELPDNNQTESGYPASGANMAQNTVLLHLNEGGGATTFADTSGLGNNGHCTGAGCPAAGAAGRFNSALTFDGSSDFATIANSPSTNISGTISLEAWINPLSVAGIQDIVSHGLSTPEVFLRINNGNYETGSWDGSMHSISTTMPATDIGKWVHLAGVYSGTGWLIYRNGVQAGVISDTIGALATSAGWTLGSRGAGTDRFYRGQLDEVAVYSRALSAQEVLDHYKRGATRLKFQVRSCADSACSLSQFVGPDGTANSYFSELNDGLLTTPIVTFTTGVSNNLYFQYRAVMEADTLSFLPGLKKVQVDPSHSALNPTQGDCLGTSVIVCQIGSLSAGSSATITIIAVVDPKWRGSIVNNAFVSGNEIDRDQSNNQVSRSSLISTLADIAISKSARPDPVIPGQMLTYTFAITNIAGPSYAGNVQLTDVLPPKVIFLTASPGCSAAGQNVTCNFGTIAPNDTTAATIVTVLDSDMPAGIFTNTVHVSSADTDGNPANNTAFAAVEARPQAELSIVKVASSDPVAAGTTLVYTVTVSNAGPSTASNVVVTDILPSLLTLGSASGNCGSTGGGVICQLGTIPPGTSSGVTIALPITTTFANNTVITNSASVTALEFDPITSTNGTSIQTTVQQIADLDVETSVAAGVSAGEYLTYTLVVTNGGPSRATGVVLTDTAASGVTVQSLSAGCTQLSNLVSCAIGALDPGEVYSATIVVLVDPATRGTLSNTASVHGDQADNNTSNNTDLKDTIVNALTILLLDKTAAPGPAVAGSTLRYTLTVTNSGPSQATGVTITDSLPVSVSFAAAAPFCIHTGGIVTCSVGTLNPGASSSAFITVNVQPAARATVINQARVTSFENSTGTVASASTDLIASADVSIVKSANGPTVSVGDRLTYTLLINNNGPSQATNISVTDTIPLNTVLQKSSASSGACIGTTTVTCAVSRLDAFASVSVSIVVTVNQIMSGTPFANTATVAATEPDGSLLNNTSTVTTTALTQSDLVLVKTAWSPTVVAGSNLSYTLVLTNVGPTPATGITISDTLPAGTSLVSAPGCLNNAPNLTCNLPNMPAGSSTRITITVSVAAGLADGTTLLNLAHVSSNEGDANTGNNDAQASATVNRRADLQIRKTRVQPAVDAGERITYSLVITNAGPSDATGVTGSDLLSTTLSNIAVNVSQGSCSGAPSLSCAIGSLALGATAVVTVGADVAPSARGTLTNTASVAGNESDIVVGNNSSTSTTVLGTATQLSVTKSASPSVAVAGLPLTYTIAVTNGGPSDATNVRLVDVLPLNSSYASASGGQSVIQSGNRVTYTLGTLTAGQSVYATLVVTVGETVAAASNIANTVSVTSLENPVGDTFRLNTPVTRAVSLQISKTPTATVVYTGTTIGYTIDIANSGPSQASNVTISDSFPIEIRPTSISAQAGVNCQPVAQLVLCTVATMDPGDTASITVRGTLTTTVKNAALITNTALVTSSEDLTGVRGSGTITASGLSNVAIRKFDAPDPAVAGNVLTYTIGLTNTDSVVATNVIVVDQLPFSGSGTPITVTTPAGASCDNTSGPYVCTITSLAIGASSYITFNILLPSDLVSPTITFNTASVTSNQSILGATTSISTTIRRLAGLQLTLQGSSSTVNAGDIVTYTMTMTNSGPSTAANVVVSNTMPSQGSFVSATDNACSPLNASSVRCSIGTLPPFSTTQRSLAVLINEATLPNTTITDTARLTATEDLVGIRRSVSETVNQLVNLTFDKLPPAGPVIAGAPLTYTLLLTNSGPSVSLLARVTDSIPVSMTFRNIGNGCSPVGGVIVCTVSSIGGHSTAVRTISFDTNNNVPAGTVVTNTASATTSEVTTPMTATATINFTRLSTLTLTKLSEPSGNVNAGDVLTYTVTFTNTGPTLATGIRLTDSLPISVTFGIKSFSAGLSCVPPIGTMTCGLGSLGVGLSASVVLTGTIGDTTGLSEINNTAKATADDFPIGVTATVTNPIKPP